MELKFRKVQELKEVIHEFIYMIDKTNNKLHLEYDNLNKEYILVYDYNKQFYTGKGKTLLVAYNSLVDELLG